MRRLAVLAAMALCAASPAVAGAYVDALTSKLEQAALTMLPTNQLHEAMGFFGPVTKKYMPVFRAFNDEYLAAEEKMPVVAKYLPKANAAFAEAQKMRVPAKYEARKAEYLRMFKAFLVVTRLTVAGYGFGSR